MGQMASTREIVKVMGIAILAGIVVTGVVQWVWPSQLARMGFGRVINGAILFGASGAMIGALAHRYWRTRQEDGRQSLDSPTGGGS
jgi:hypothetical protein